MKTILSKALLGFHAFSGCDQTGKFYGYSKKSCWETLTQSTDDVLDAFCGLGSNEHQIENDLTKFEKFVMNLFCKNNCPVNITTLAELRWKMFSKNQADSIQLPPTLAALREKVLRAHFITLQWKSSHIPSPILPDPNDYGWSFNEEDQVFEPVMTSLAPAPESIIDLTVCGCKTNCSTNRCKCRRTGLNCSEMCGCENCENSEKDEETVSDINPVDNEPF